MKKLFIFIIGFLLVIGLASCSNTNKIESSEEVNLKNQYRTLDEIKKSKKLILGTNPEYPPFSFIQDIDGKEVINGVDVMFAERIAKSIGVELEVKGFTLPQVLKELDAGNVDLVISSIEETDETRIFADFSRYYYAASEGSVFLVDKDDENNYPYLGDVKDKTIGVQKGSITSEFIRNDLKTSTIKEFDTLVKLKEALDTNTIDCALMKYSQYKNWELEYPNQFVSTTNNYSSEIGRDNSTNRGYGYGYVVAVGKGNSELIDVVNQAIVPFTEGYDYYEMIKEAQILSNNYNILGKNPNV